MTTINLFVIANVKQLRTCSFRILLPCFRTSWGVGVLNSAILTVFTVGLSLARFWRAFGILEGGLNPTTPPRHATVISREAHHQGCVSQQSTILYYSEIEGYGNETGERERLKAGENDLILLHRGHAFISNYNLLHHINV